MTTTAFRSTLPDPNGRKKTEHDCGQNAHDDAKRDDHRIDPHMIEARQVRGAKRDQESDP